MFTTIASSSFIAIFGLSLLLVFNPYSFIERIFMHIQPSTWASLGIALCCGLSVLGAGIGMYVCGSSLMGAAVRKPEIRTRHLISILFCEAVAIYGIVFSIILSVMYTSMPTTPSLQGNGMSLENWQAGYGMFWSGVTVGVVNLAGGVCVGSIGSSAAVVDAQSPALFVRLVVLEVLASAIGLFGLISGFIQVSSIKQLL